jgi:hypothetical protein
MKQLAVATIVRETHLVFLQNHALGLSWIYYSMIRVASINMLKLLHISGQVSKAAAEDAGYG